MLTLSCKCELKNSGNKIISRVTECVIPWRKKGEFCEILHFLNKCVVYVSVLVPLLKGYHLDLTERKSQNKMT